MGDVAVVLAGLIGFGFGCLVAAGLIIFGYAVMWLADRFDR